MRLFLSFSFLTFLGCITNPVNAIYASQVGQVDWHQQYVGIPIVNLPALAPRMHRMGGTQPGQPAQAVILAATMKNVLAAINPSEGNIVWRRKFEEEDTLIAFKGNMDGLVSLSGRGGATARIYEAINGNLIWEQHLHEPTSGHLARLHDWESSGAAIEFDTIDVFILSAGCTIKRLSGVDGSVIWSWTHKHLATKVFLTHIIRTSDALYVVGISRGIMDLSIQVTSLDPETGVWINAVEIPASIKSGDDFYPLKIGSTSKVGGLARIAGLAWLEAGSLKQIMLTPSLDSKHLAKPAANKYGPYSEIQSLGVNERGYVVALLKDETTGGGKDNGAHVYRMDLNGIGLNKVGDLSPSASATPYTSYAGGLDRNGDAYIAKFAHSSSSRTASYTVFAPAAIGGRGMSTGFSFEYDPILHGAISHAVIDVANTGEYSYASRLILTTSSGSLQKWQQEEFGWIREESLTEIKAITAMDLPELASNSHMLYRTTDENLIERIVRQLGDLKDLPLYILHFVQRFISGTYSIPATAHGGTASGLWRDTYGFKKVLVAATSTGKIFGIETSKGKTVWGIKLGTGGVDIDMKIRPIRMIPLKTVSEGFQPEVGLVVEVDQSKDDGSVTTTTGMVRLDALTGTSQSTVVFRGPILEAFEIDVPLSIDTSGLGHKLIGMVDSDHKVYVYPHQEDAIALFNNITSVSSFALTTGPSEQRSLQGFGLSPLEVPPKPADVDPATYEPPVPIWTPFTTWRSSFPRGESVVSVVRRIPGIAASHGRVIADRSTLYKYLNPHLVAVVTESQGHKADSYTAQGEEKPHCTLYLLDSSKGTVLYSSVILTGSVHAKCDIKVSLVENWLVYHYYDTNEAATTGTKGWKIVSVELYEGAENVKSKSGELSADAAKRGSVSVIEQSFVFPYGIKALTATSTKFGISSKDIVVINNKNQVQTYSRRFLDPRRPKNKPTAAESEEGLIQYDVLLPDDPRRVVSHNYQLIADQLLTTPTYLESTSLVLAYGGDLFLTRVAPSGTFDVLSENFNKIQLVLTVAALVVSILITRPLVKQKILKGKWFS